MRIALLHGFAGGPWAWDDVIAAWPRPGDELVALDLAVPVHASWDDNVAVIARTIGAVDLVVGYSLGARIALALVAGNLAPRAVLLSVNPGIADAERPARRASDARWARLLRERGIAAFLDAWEAQPLFASQARVPADRLAARRAHRLALDPEALARSLEVMGLAEMPDYRETLDLRAKQGYGSRSKTVEDFALVAGADDAKYLAIAQALGRPLRVIAACGHDPLLEQPRALAAVLAGLADAPE